MATRRWPVLLVLPLVAACGDYGSEPPASDGMVVAPPPATVSFAADIQPIFDANCIVCHGDGGFEALDLRQGISYGLIVGVTAQESPLSRIDPGSPATSYLYLKITGAQASGERMPYGLPPLPPSTIDLIRTWIEEGALDN